MPAFRRMFQAKQNCRHLDRGREKRTLAEFATQGGKIFKRAQKLN
jgi:hypothetical protein